MKLAPFSYFIQYRLGQKNFAPDTFIRANCSAVTATSYMSSSILQDIYEKLFHPGVLTCDTTLEVKIFRFPQLMLSVSSNK